MTTRQIGVVYDLNTREIVTVIAPAANDELDDPAWTAGENGRRLAMLRLPRLKDAYTFEDIGDLVETAAIVLSNWSEADGSCRLQAN